jgi:DNA-directed RNA polymerase specialized sigma24 family protein
MAIIRKGDWTPVEDELSGFCEALYVLICKIACIFIYDPEERQEVIQRAVEKIIFKRHKLYTWPEPWRVGYIVTTVIRHHWHVSNQNRRWLFVEDGGKVSFADEDADPYYALAAEEVHKIGAMAMEMAEEVLTEDQYDVFRLRLNGKSYKDIGAALGRSDVACRKSWHQSLKKLARAARKRGLI